MSIHLSVSQEAQERGAGTDPSSSHPRLGPVLTIPFDGLVLDPSSSFETVANFLPVTFHRYFPPVSSGSCWRGPFERAMSRRRRFHDPGALRPVQFVGPLAFSLESNVSARPRFCFTPDEARLMRCASRATRGALLRRFLSQSKGYGTRGLGQATIEPESFFASKSCRIAGGR